MRKRVYRQNLWKLTYLSLAAGLMLFFAACFSAQLLSVWLEPEQENRDGILIFLASGAVLGLIAVLIIWLMLEKKTIAIDSNGFELTVSRPLGRKQRQRFEWQDVTATFMRTKTYRGRSGSVTKYIFRAVAQGKSVELIERGKYFRRNLIEVIASAKAGTPHLKYFWDECRQKETRRILQTVSPFCQVSRN